MMKFYVGLSVAVLSAGVYLTACTDSPFGANKIAAQKLTIGGNLRLSDQGGWKGAYVWLEGFDIGLRTEEEGRFELELPPIPQQANPEGVSGVFKIYFFVSNYELTFREVTVVDGEFLYQGVISETGQFRDPIILQKTLDVRVDLDPTRIFGLVGDSVKVDVYMRSFESEPSTTIILPASKLYPKSAIFVQNIENDDVFVFKSVFGQTNEPAFLVSTIFEARELGIVIKPQELPAGTYRIVPQLVIVEQTLPEGLAEFVSIEYRNPGNRAYLDLPFFMESELLVVQ